MSWDIQERACAVRASVVKTGQSGSAGGLQGAEDRRERAAPSGWEEHQGQKVALDDRLLGQRPEAPLSSLVEGFLSRGSLWTRSCLHTVWALELIKSGQGGSNQSHPYI